MKKMLLTTKTRDFRKAHLFSNTCRFIDNDLEFDRNFKNLYSVTTQKRKHFNIVSIIFRTFYYNWTQLYHKRDAFTFSIVCIPHLDCNIP